MAYSPFTSAQSRIAGQSATAPDKAAALELEQPAGALAEQPATRSLQQAGSQEQTSAVGLEAQPQPAIGDTRQQLSVEVQPAEFQEQQQQQQEEGASPVGQQQQDPEQSQTSSLGMLRAAVAAQQVAIPTPGAIQAPGGAGGAARRFVSGAQAVQAARARGAGTMARIAAKAGLTVDALERALTTDSTLKLDPVSEGLVYMEPLVEDLMDGEAAGQLPGVQGMTQGMMTKGTVVGPVALQQEPALSDAFKLHSRPSADWLIILDFTGGARRWVREVPLGSSIGPVMFWCSWLYWDVPDIGVVVFRLLMAQGQGFLTQPSTFVNFLSP